MTSAPTAARRPGRRLRSAAMPAALAVILLLGIVPAAGETRTFDLSIRNGQLPADARVIRVRQVDDVTLRWTADAALTVHLHGYDIEATPVPGTPRSMRFTARATGRFPIEVHAAGRVGERTIGHFEVHPR